VAKLTRRHVAVASLTAPMLLLRDRLAHAQLTDAPAHPLPADSPLRDTAVDAYIFGYPLVTMEMTRRVSTNLAQPEGARAPMGQFANLREYPTAAYRDVTAPNADTLYSVAWLDLSDGPWVLHVPDEHGRYYLMPMLEGWTNVFADPGTRTTGTGAGDFAIAGPGWQGELPPGVELLRSSTNMVWVLGRTYCAGTPEDYAAVHAIQDQYKIFPLSSWGKPYSPPAGKVDPGIDMKAAPREQVESMDPASYFKLLASLMKQNPPYAADAPALERFRAIGLVAGRDFDATKLAAVPGVQDVPKLAVQRIMAHFRQGGEDLNGWVFFKPAGRYGTDYLQRAIITRLGLGCNLLEDAVYPTALADAAGRELDGTSGKYVVRFPKGQMPPARAFWSITMYDAEYFFVANPLNRYTLSSRNALKADTDGSVPLYIQADSPGPEKESNWLPAPKAPFVLMLRMYWPKTNPPSILDGTWKPPVVERV
jgi:hypothetical protein